MWLVALRSLNIYSFGEIFFSMSRRGVLVIAQIFEPSYKCGNILKMWREWKNWSKIVFLVSFGDDGFGDTRIEIYMMYTHHIQRGLTKSCLIICSHSWARASYWGHCVLVLPTFGPVLVKFGPTSLCACLFVLNKGVSWCFDHFCLLQNRKIMNSCWLIPIFRNLGRASPTFGPIFAKFVPRSLCACLFVLHKCVSWCFDHFCLLQKRKIINSYRLIPVFRNLGRASPTFRPVLAKFGPTSLCACLFVLNKGVSWCFDHFCLLQNRKIMNSCWLFPIFRNLSRAGLAF